MPNTTWEWMHRSCFSHSPSVFLQCLNVYMICLPPREEMHWEHFFVAPLSINYPIVMLFCSVCIELQHNLVQAMLLSFSLSLFVCPSLYLIPSLGLYAVAVRMTRQAFSWLSPQTMFACLIYLSYSLFLPHTHFPSHSPFLFFLLAYFHSATSTCSLRQPLSLLCLFFLSASLFFSLDLAVAFPLSSSLFLAVALPLSFSICLYQEPWLIIL